MQNQGLTVTRRAASLAIALSGLGGGAAAQERPRINIREVGSGSRSWLLLHPFTASGRFWESRARILADEHNVTVIYPDLPSHGGSRLVQRFDYDDAADAVAAAFASRRASIDLIVGASSGGLVGLKLAADWSCPVVGVGVGAAFSEANVASLREESMSLRPQTRVAIAAFLEQGAPQQEAIQRHFADLAALGRRPLFTPAETAALARRALIINGSHDSFFLPDAAHALAESISGSQLLFLTGADHLEPLAPAFRDATWAFVAAFSAAR